MRILFISRAYPPVTGGIENQNYALSLWLKRVQPTDTIANHHGKKALFWFLPFVTLVTLWKARRYDVILLGDGVLAIVGWIIKLFFPKKTVVSVIHGLDILYKNPFYQLWWVGHFLPALDGLIAVSEETRQSAIAKHIPADNITVVHNGIDTDSVQGRYTRDQLADFLHENLSDKFVLLTSGRLAKRKGAEWFIRFVLPHLPEKILYVLAGDGPEKKQIENAIRETALQNRVYLLGKVSDTERNLLLNTIDVFVQPNIKVPHDMEGFGIAVIEASACGRPVIASDLEGLRDAIRHKENGLLVESGNPESFIQEIIRLFENEEERKLLGNRARHYTEMTYHWNIISRLYIEALAMFIKKNM
ncbi:MAG: glycosyltransferase family 4 protein [Minisyncoccota bacterium]